MAGNYPWDVNLDLAARLTLGLLHDPAQIKSLEDIYEKSFYFLLDKVIKPRAPIVIDEANKTYGGSFDKTAITALIDKLHAVFNTNQQWTLEDLYRKDTTGPNAWPATVADLSRQLVSHGVLMNYLFIPDGMPRINAGKFFDNDFDKIKLAYSMQTLYETKKDPNNNLQIAEYARVLKGLKAGVIRCYPTRTYDHLWPHQGLYGKLIGNKLCCDGTTCVNSQTNPNHYCDLAMGGGCTMGSDEC